jgi:hypothetical protein
MANRGERSEWEGYPGDRKGRCVEQALDFKTRVLKQECTALLRYLRIRLSRLFVRVDWTAYSKLAIPVFS